MLICEDMPKAVTPQPKWEQAEDDALLKLVALQKSANIEARNGKGNVQTVRDTNTFFTRSQILHHQNINQKGSYLGRSSKANA